MTTPLRFSDNEYKNWIICSLALIRSKESLHDYVDTEVKNIHAYIQQNAAIPGGQCNSCTSKIIKYKGGQHGGWNIKCPNKICDKWLSQILLEHNDPLSRTINWKNADISKWPTDGYEVAKVYMPKGQDKAKNLPEDFDAPAILSLFKYCAWFTQKISNTAIVSDLIDIQNEVFHSGVLRVTDSKKNICIDNTVQLLSDLGINPDVVSELQKLKLEDIDINYRETEVRALRTILSAVQGNMDSLLADQTQLTSDLDTAQITLSSLQNMQTQQGKEMDEIKGNTTETAGKVVTIETDIQAVQTELEQRRETFQKIKSFIENNPDIDDKNITENIREIEKTVTDLQSRLHEVEKDIVDIKTAISEIPDIKTAISSIERKFAEGEEIIEKKQMHLQEAEVEGLRDELLSQYKSLRTIPISPFDEKEVCPLENVYTDIIIKCKDEERNNQEQDKKPASDCLSFKGRQRIILTGLSGSGKSTFCRKIVNRWYKLQEKKKMAANADVAGPSTHDSSDVIGSLTKDFSDATSSLTHESSNEVERLPDDSSCVAKLQTDEIADPLTISSFDRGKSSMTDSSYAIADEDLLRFDLLFYIYSPVISIETKLVELLCNQCIKRELEKDKNEVQEKVSKLLIDQSEKILIIFDGLDELGHTPDFLVDLFKRALYAGITVLMGMRPWQISRLGLKSRDHYDLCLDIQGFSEDNALKFAEKVIDLNNRMYGQKKPANISYKDSEMFLSFKHLPLLLLFLTHIWYRDQSLPDTHKNLYNQILDCLILRCLTKRGNKYFEPKLLQENMDLCSKMFHEKYLNSAYKAAHHFLLKREGGVSVVIPQKELIQELGDDADMKLDALLDCGIMSKVDFFSPLEKNVSVTFLHMSVQEYLASIHLVQNEHAFQFFLQSLTTLNDVLRYENLFIFVCGLDASQGHKAFIRICQVCDVDPLVLEYRHKLMKSFSCGDIFRLKTLYKTCIDEMDKTERLEIPDIICVCGRDCYEQVMSKSSCYLKSISSPTYLTKFLVGHNSLSEEQSRSLCSSISSLSSLQKLELGNFTLTDGVLDLSKQHDLIVLSLDQLSITERCSETLFSSIRACTKLKKLYLHDIKLHGVLDLSKLHDLIVLSLDQLSISERCSETLFSSIRACTKLKKLYLHDITLHGVLALHTQTCLEHFSLDDATLNSTLHLTHLTIFRLSKVTMPVECIQSLVSSISACTKLKELELCDTTLHDGVLALHTLACPIFIHIAQVVMSDECSRSLCSSISGCTCLEILDLENTSLNDGILDLNCLTHLKKLTLMSVTMSVECIQSLVSRISACTNMEVLCLSKISLRDGVLDLKTLTSLTHLGLESLTMSVECVRSLVSSISACTKLKRLLLTGTSLHDGVLDLKTLTSLIYLELASLTMSVECARSLVSSISACTKLKKLILTETSLHDGVLDLKTLTSLTCLLLESLTMSVECVRSLVSSISACTNLEYLSLLNTSLHDAVLDLKKFRKFILEISNVKISDECRNILKESEKHCPKLRIMWLT